MMTAHRVFLSAEYRDGYDHYGKPGYSRHDDGHDYQLGWDDRARDNERERERREEEQAREEAEQRRCHDMAMERRIEEQAVEDAFWAEEYERSQLCPEASQSPPEEPSAEAAKETNHEQSNVDG